MPLVCAPCLPVFLLVCVLCRPVRWTSLTGFYGTHTYKPQTPLLCKLEVCSFSQVFTTKYLLTEESTSSLSLPSPPHEEVTVSQPKEQVTASPNWGVLLDVSGSMQSAYATDSKRDVSVQRTHTLFTTVANIVGKEVANHKRYQSIFACGFGIQEPAPVCNLIPLFELLRDLRLSQSQPQDLVRLARQHEAPHAERWITKHLTEKEASVLNYLLRKDESLIPRLIEKLPQDSIAVRGFGAILSFVESLPVIGGAAEAQETQMVTTSEAYTYAQDIMRTAFLNSFNKPIKSSSVIHVSKVMCELLETEQASASSSSESLRDYVQELVDYIKPYIYGGTPMCMAMNEAVRIFKQADPDMEKVLFVLSDGESGDGDPCPIAQELHALGVCIVTCYLTSDRLDNPKHLLYHANPDWRDGRLALFKMSSTMKNTHTPISYLIDAGWQLPASGESRLFVQANSMEIVNEFCETVVKHLTKGCDALVDVLAKVPLATYINQYNADFIPKKEQYGGTCYANAIAATFHLAMHRIVGREGGIPDFYTIRERIIHEYGQHGATADRVLEKVCPEYRLHFRKVEETGARQAINQRRPVVATYGLYAEEWDNFSRFFRNAKKGILKRADVQTSE